MKMRLIAAAALLTHGAMALAHDPSEFRRQPAAEPKAAESAQPQPDAKDCARFEGKEASKQNMKDAATKAAHDRCVASGAKDTKAGAVHR